MSTHTRCLYEESISTFVNEGENSIFGTLCDNYHGDAKTTTREAWKNEILIMKKVLTNFYSNDGQIIFEYDIVRLGKRIDVVLLIKHMVFSLEFKNGAKQYLARDAEQAEDYALDLKNFHKESENLYVCPILIATDAPEYKKEQSLNCYPDRQVHLQRENIDTVISKVQKLTRIYGDDQELDFDRKEYETPSGRILHKMSQQLYCLVSGRAEHAGGFVYHERRNGYFHQQSIPESGQAAVRTLGCDAAVIT